MARPKVYNNSLTGDKHFKLEKTIKNKSTCKTVLKRCHILCDLDEINGAGLTHSQIAHTYAVYLENVYNIVKVYVDKDIYYIVRYNISPNSAAAPRKVDGPIEARTFQIACIPAPDAFKMTFQFLEDKACIKIVTPIKGNYPQGAKKANFDLTSTTTGAYRQKKT